MPADLWLEPVSLVLREQARRALEEGDVCRFLISAENTSSLDLVWHNVSFLKERGLYEKALLDAFISTRTNNHHWPLHCLRLMFDLADPSRLRAAGDPLPGSGPFTLVSGRLRPRTCAPRARAIVDGFA